MKINVNNLMVALGRISNSYDRNPIQPQYKCVYLHNENDTLTLRATDLQSTAQIKVACVSEKPFETLVDFATLQDIASKTKAAKEDVITMSLATKLVVSSGLATLRLSVMDSVLFPAFSFVESPDDDEISTADFLAALSCGAFCHKDRVPLTGVHFGNVIEATNGFYGKRIEVPSVTFSGDIVIPDKAVKALQSLSQLNETVIKVQESTNSLTFYGDEWVISVQLLQGNYPDTSSGYNNSAQNTLVLDKDEFQSVLQILSIVGDTLQIAIDYDTISLSVVGDEGSERVMSVPDGQLPNKISLDIKMLLQIIKDLDSNTVNMIIGTRQQPILIEDNNTVYFCVQYG